MKLNVSCSGEGACWQGEVLKQEVKMIDVAGPCHSGGGSKRGGRCSVLGFSSWRSPRAGLCSLPGENEVLLALREWGHGAGVWLLIPAWVVLLIPPCKQMKGEPGPTPLVGAASGEDDGLCAPP